MPPGHKLGLPVGSFVAKPGGPGIQFRALAEINIRLGLAHSLLFSGFFVTVAIGLCDPAWYPGDSDLSKIVAENKVRENSSGKGYWPRQPKSVMLSALIRSGEQAVGG